MHRFKSLTGGALALALILTTTAPALAQDAPTLNSGDTAWMLISTVIVLMMTIPGLALFYGGLVRSKNVLATIMQSFSAACLITLVWFIVGYSLAFSNGGGLDAYIGGFSNFMFASLTKDGLSGTIPESVFAIFQMTFAIITPALICGAFADRMKFSALLLFLTLWSIFVYSPICHWVWSSGGFLFGAGVLDFAGGTVVHINSGVAALVACIVLGRRVGYPSEPMPPHNLVYSMIGASLLWVGWFGFNAGSALAANTTAGIVLANTQIATAGAGLAWMFAEWAVHKKPSVLGILSGAVAGLVAITPACGFVTPTGGLIIGIVAGVVCFWASTSLKRMLGYDDSLDVFGIHGVGGLTGAILTGVFASTSINTTAGLLEGNAGQVMTQIYGVLATVIWCGVVTFIILKIVDAIVGLRVSRDTEIEGLDINLHGEVVP